LIVKVVEKHPSTPKFKSVTMSLKVPKNGQMQLFKEGYKVSMLVVVERPDMLISV
jgi:hypothetical protein